MLYVGLVIFPAFGLCVSRPCSPQLRRPVPEKCQRLRHPDVPATVGPGPQARELPQM